MTTNGNVVIDRNTQLEVLEQEAELGNTPTTQTVELGNTPTTQTVEWGNAEAQYYFGNSYARLDNYAEAVKWLRKAAEQGNTDAQCHLGFCYLEGYVEDDDDEGGYDEAVEWFREAAEQGHASTQFYLGEYYYMYFFPSNKEEAIRWFHKAADQGYDEAIERLQEIELHEAIEPDGVEREIELIRILAERGDADEQNNLGLRYFCGDGVPENKTEAVVWFRKAVEQGHVDALYRLGICYDEGAGLPIDKIEAMNLIRKAAERGHVAAQFRLDIP